MCPRAQGPPLYHHGACGTPVSPHCPQCLGAGTHLPEVLSVMSLTRAPGRGLNLLIAFCAFLGNHFLEMLSEAKGCSVGQREGS